MTGWLGTSLKSGKGNPLNREGFQGHHVIPGINALHGR